MCSSKERDEICKNQMNRFSQLRLSLNKKSSEIRDKLAWMVKSMDQIGPHDEGNYEEARDLKIQLERLSQSLSIVDKVFRELDSLLKSYKIVIHTNTKHKKFEDLLEAYHIVAQKCLNRPVRDTNDSESNGQINRFVECPSCFICSFKIKI